MEIDQHGENKVNIIYDSSRQKRGKIKGGVKKGNIVEVIENTWDY